MKAPKGWMGAGRASRGISPGLQTRTQRRPVRRRLGNCSSRQCGRGIGKARSGLINKWDNRRDQIPSRTLGSLGFLASRSALRRFISTMQVAVRLSGLISSSVPLSHSLSWAKDGSAWEVVVD